MTAKSFLRALVMVLLACVAASAQCTRCGGLLIVSPSSLNFGSETVGAATTHSIFLRAEGSFAVTGIKILKSGPPAFSETSSCTGTLQPNQSCHISVTFAPRHTGNFSGTITIQSSGGGKTVSLSGTGVK